MSLSSDRAAVWLRPLPRALRGLALGLSLAHLLLALWITGVWLAAGPGQLMPLRPLPMAPLPGGTPA